jgi:hypothetical protein
MAIFRAGKRLGPFDIRGGISRGDYKSSAYHKTDRDPRFKMQANTDNTIGRFRSAMASAEGYARPARFAVRIFPPANLAALVKQQNNTVSKEGQVLIPSDVPEASEGAYQHQTPKYMNDLVQTYGRQINIHCENVSMPGVTLDSQSVQRGSEPARDQVVGHNYEGEIQATFYADKYLRERHFFEAWQKLAVEPIGHKANYYDNYVGKMHIYQLGDDNDITEIRDMPSYGIEAIEVYPKTIAAVEYGYGKSNEIVRVQVGFAYKQWYNMGTNPESGRLSDDTLPFGTLRQRAAQVKARNPGLLGMLPPSIGRAARGAISQGRTVLNPVGRIFKGKVFPPFT